MVWTEWNSLNWKKSPMQPSRMFNPTSAVSIGGNRRNADGWSSMQMWVSDRLIPIWKPEHGQVGSDSGGPGKARMVPGGWTDVSPSHQTRVSAVTDPESMQLGVGARSRIP